MESPTLVIEKDVLFSVDFRDRTDIAGAKSAMIVG